MKVIIAGGRDFRHFRQLEIQCDHILYDYFMNEKEDELEIVSGGQVTTDPVTEEKYGADYYGEVYAEQCGIKVKRFLPDWNKYGRGAGPRRNKEMAQYVAPDGMLIAFWDEASDGTRNMILEAKKLKIKTHIIKY
jgi:hypothetical protein